MQAPPRHLVERLGRELELDAVQLEQPLVLAHEGVARLGEDGDEGRAVELAHGREHREPADELGDHAELEQVLRHDVAEHVVRVGVGIDALTGSFEMLTNSVVFASWTFYALNAGSVMLLRRRFPERARPYRVPFFPVIPALFVVLSGLLLINTVLSSFRDSALGLILMGLSVPVYAITLWRTTSRQQTLS